MLYYILNRPGNSLSAPPTPLSHLRTKTLFITSLNRISIVTPEGTFLASILKRTFWYLYMFLLFFYKLLMPNQCVILLFAF